MSLRKIDADWDRTKEFLIRSLFQDLPPFSPVPEEDESADSSYSRTHPPSVAPVRSYSPPSPLPPLIIETEPNRHDEPEEYYRRLEKRVLRYYKKLFIEDLSDVSVNESSDEDFMVDLDNATVINATCERRKSFQEMDHDLDEDDSQNDLDEVSAKEIIDNAGADANLERRKSYENMDYDLDEEDDSQNDLDKVSDKEMLNDADDNLEGRKSFENMDEDNSQNDFDEVSANEMIDNAGTDANLVRGKGIVNTDDDLCEEDDLDKESPDIDRFRNKDNDLEENYSHIELDNASVNINKTINKSACQKLAITEEDFIDRSIEDEDNDDTNRSSSEVLPKSTSDENDNFDSVSVAADGEDTEETDGVTSSPPTEYSAEYRLVTFRADVHRDCDEEPPGVYRQDTGDIAAVRHFGVVEDMAALEDNDVPGAASDNPEVEVMRTPRHPPSAESLPPQGHSSSPEHPRRSDEEQRLESHTESSSPDLRRESVSTDFNVDFEALHRISIPNVNECSRSGKESSIRKRGISSSSVSSKRVRYEDAGTQMSYERDRDVLRDIFVGRPLVYRLCMCVDHSCTGL